MAIERRDTIHGSVQATDPSVAAGAVISGYASRWYDPSIPGTQFRIPVGRTAILERVLPGAFTRALREDTVLALLNHNPDYVLGKSGTTMRLSVDSKGLRYDIQTSRSPMVDSVTEMIRRGDVSGSSFSFIVRPGGATYREAKINGEIVTIRELTDLQLIDVSPVAYPAYKASTSWVSIPAPPPARATPRPPITPASIADINSERSRRHRSMRADMVRLGICN